MKRINLKNQRGFLSLDSMFWLALLAIAIGYVAVLGFRALMGSEVAVEQGNISTLLANTRKLKGTSGYGTSGQNLVPSLIALDGTGTMGVSGSTISNQWNGSVTVVSRGMTFTLTETAIPKSACVTLATKVAKDSQSTTSINGATAVTGEVLPATAASGCSSDSNTIAWTMY